MTDMAVRDTRLHNTHAGRMATVLQGRMTTVLQKDKGKDSNECAFHFFILTKQTAGRPRRFTRASNHNRGAELSRTYSHNQHMHAHLSTFMHIMHIPGLCMPGRLRPASLHVAHTAPLVKHQQ
jgi:hypothetical protein